MEINNKNINYLNKKVSILQYLSESNNQFNKRIDYIKLLENAKIDWKEAYRLSKIWYCIKYKNCKYSPDIHYKVISYENRKNT